MLSDQLQATAGMLQDSPWQWDVTVEYPGFLSVSFDNGDGTRRYYVTGDANDTFTVDYYETDKAYEDGRPSRHGDTKLHVSEFNHYRLAIQFAATIDRMEN